MGKQKQDTHIEAEQEYSLHILYSSPPEAATLEEWVREVEGKQNQGSDDEGSAPHSEEPG